MISLRYICIIPFENTQYVILRNSKSDTLLPIELDSQDGAAFPVPQKTLFSFFTTYTDSLRSLGAHVSAVLILPDENGSFTASFSLESAMGLTRIPTNVLIGIGLAIKENIPVLTSEEILARAAQKQNALFSKILMAMPGHSQSNFASRDFLRMLARHVRTTPLNPVLADAVRLYFAGASHLSPEDLETGQFGNPPASADEEDPQEALERKLAALTPVNEKPM